MQKDLVELNPLKLNFVKRVCGLCNSDQNVPLYSVKFLNSRFYFVRCKNCGLVYQNPNLDKPSLEHIYETIEYWEHKHASTNDSDMLNYYSYFDDSKIRSRNCEIRLKWIGRYLPQGANILDLGCSDGLFVHILSKAGYKASGIDISASMISQGESKYSADIRRADFEDDWMSQKKFDAIACFATLSNFVNPSLVFANIDRYLKKGGYLFFNFGSYDRLCSKLLRRFLYLYRPTASTIYSKKTIENYCGKFNLNIVDMFDDMQVVPLMRLLVFLE